MGLQQKLTGLVEPNDLRWKAASNAERRAFYSKAGDVALERLKKQLSRGVGANGRAMKPRKQAVLDDGADGPVMEPHYDLSRVIRLSDYQATDRSLTLFWQAGTGHASHRQARKKGKKATPFGTILQYHADGLVRNAPVRDVRLSRASIHQVKLEMRKWWDGQEPPQPKPRPRPANPTPPAVGPHPTPTQPIPVHHAVPKGKIKGPVFVVTGREAKKFPEFKGAASPAPVRPPAPKSAPKPAPTAAAVERQLGVKLVRDESARGRRLAVVVVDLEKLAAELAKDAGSHVGPGGTGPSARPGAYEAFREFLAKAQARQGKGEIEIPRLALGMQGQATVENGRHRLAVFRDLGVKFLPVAVPRSEAARFRRMFGG